MMSRYATVAVLLVATVGAQEPPRPLNWAADDDKRVAELTARGERSEGRHVVLWTPRDALSSAQRQALVERLDKGVAALRTLVGRHAWQSIKDEPITYYISADRFVSHGSGRAAVFIPLARIQDGKAPLLHEAMHELLATPATRGQMDAARLARIKTRPLWLGEGLPDYVAQRAAAETGIAEGDVFDIGGLAGVDRTCAVRLREARGSEVLQFIGAPGRPDALFTTERQAVAPTFYACSTSFTKFIVGRLGLAETIALVPLIATDQVHSRIEERTGESMEALRAEWLRAIGQAAEGSPASANRVTVLYDAFGKASDLERDWGFSALVEYGGKRILFDTGNDAGIFERNVTRLGVDLTRLDAAIVSHRHGDHTTGLDYLLQRNPGVRIYAPQEGAFFKSPMPRGFFTHQPGLPPELQYVDLPEGRTSGTPWPHADFQIVTRPMEIMPGVYVLSTQSRKPGTMEMNEVSLAIRTPRGLAVVVGCSHPGVETILAQAAAIDPRLYTVTGGFHLVMAPREEVERVAGVLRDELKVERVAPGHCTSEQGFALFLERFKDRYDRAGVGATIDLP